MKYYKSLTKDHKGPFSFFDFIDYLPKGNKPGKWLPIVKTLKMCESGWHCATAIDLIDWLKSEVYEVELRGKIIKGGDKVCAEQMRITKQVMSNYNIRLFACDCAERVIPIFEREIPNDKRPRQAIETARRKDSTTEERAAAESAAWAAAESAAWAAAESAARAAAESAAWAAAWAAGDAAWAAGAAARAAAEAAEKKWQVKRLKQYLSGKRG